MTGFDSRLHLPHQDVKPLGNDLTKVRKKVVKFVF